MNPTTELITDAFIIADSAARSDIEIYCRAVMEPGTRMPIWYDTRHMIDVGDGDLAADIARLVRYLSARGKIECQPGAPYMVRFPKAPKATAS